MRRQLEKRMEGSQGGSLRRGWRGVRVEGSEDTTVFESSHNLCQGGATILMSSNNSFQGV